MNALVYHGNGNLQLEARNAKPVGPRDVRLRVDAAGICGTDIHILRGEYDSSPPVVLGHELAGEITEVGSDVSHVAVGDVVTVEPHIYCGICKYCVSGQEHMCVRKQAFGVHLDGGFAQEVTVPARNAYRLPAGMSASVGALAEPFGCVVHGIDQAQIRTGADVGVFGAGPIGLLLVKLARSAGAARVVVVEPDARRRALAETFGGTHVLHPDDATQAIADITDGYGLDVAFEATGLPNVLVNALAALGRGGRLIVFGVATPSAEAELSPFRIYRDELSIVGSLTNPFTHRRAVSLLASLDVGHIVSHTFALKEFRTAFDVAEKGEGLKVHIAPNT